MSDFGAPATPNYTAPDGLATLGNLMSLKHAQQGLIGQQSQNQILASEAVNAQQGAKETQAGAQLLSDPVGNGLTDEEGNPAKGARAKIMAAMPITGDKHYQDLLTAATGNVQYKNAWLKLRSDVRQDVSSRLAGAAADPATGMPELGDTIENIKKDYAGTPAAAEVNTIADVSKQAIDKAGQKHGINGAKQVIMGFSRGGLGNAGITGQNGLMTPQPTPVQGKQGLNFVNTNPNAGPVGAPLGQPVTDQGVSPEAKLPQAVTTPAGIVNREPLSGALSAPTQNGPVRPGAPNLNPTQAQAGFANASSQGIGERVQQAQTAANGTIQTQDALTRAMKILEAPSAPGTGTAFELKRSLGNTLSSLGIDTEGATDANELVKNLARYEAGRATQAGLGGTDAARNLAHGGSPHAGTDNAALRDVVRQSLATEKAVSAYAKIQTGQTDPAKAAATENAFRNVPNLIETYEYGMMRDPKEASAFLKKHGMSHDSVIESVAKLKQLGAL